MAERPPFGVDTWDLILQVDPGGPIQDPFRQSVMGTDPSLCRLVEESLSR